jgi:hypothetical protein
MDWYKKELRRLHDMKAGWYDTVNSFISYA